MKQIALPTRLNMFVNTVLYALVTDGKPSIASGLENEPLNSGRDRPERKEFFYYSQLIDADTKQVVGNLADISSGGFKLDTQNPISINKDFRFYMNLTDEMAGKPFMAFMARSRWCRRDPIDSYTYNVGFQLIHISPEDLEILNRMMEKYGKEYNKSRIGLRRFDKW